MTTIDITSLAGKAKQASRLLAAVPGFQRAQAINAMAQKLHDVKAELLMANARDMENARRNGASEPFLKRLAVTDKIFNYMERRLVDVAALPDPVGKLLEGRVMPTGLKVSKIAVPMGVIAIIYEARPNVTTDAASVALKSANAVILRGGSESLLTNQVLVSAMKEAVAEAGLPEDAIQFLDSTDHEDVNTLLQQDQFIDLVIPRGGKSLIKAVTGSTSIPVLKHYDGICHQYVAEDADLEMAVKVVLNSKTQRVEVCNALETLLVNRRIAPAFLPQVAEAFMGAGVQIRGCQDTCQIIPQAVPATDEDWDAEYLAPVIAIKIVDSLQEAAEHIARHGSGHTDGIITSSLDHARTFTAMVDSASVMVNASTRLSGGGDYGMGAVVGISTGKLHARGPVGPAELCSYKWIAEGNGHLRE